MELPKRDYRIQMRLQLKALLERINRLNLRGKYGSYFYITNCHQSNVFGVRVSNKYINICEP